jgi:hypothetical protein
MTDSDQKPLTPPPATEEIPGKSVADERLPDLAELEQEIRRRLRSNERFLERFLDEDFVDDDGDIDDAEEGDEEEEL